MQCFWNRDFKFIQFLENSKLKVLIVGCLLFVSMASLPEIVLGIPAKDVTKNHDLDLTFSRYLSSEKLDRLKKDVVTGVQVNDDGSLILANNKDRFAMKSSTIPKNMHVQIRSFPNRNLVVSQLQKSYTALFKQLDNQGGKTVIVEVEHDYTDVEIRAFEELKNEYDTLYSGKSIGYFVFKKYFAEHENVKDIQNEVAKKVDWMKKGFSLVTKLREARPIKLSPEAVHRLSTLKKLVDSQFDGDLKEYFSNKIPNTVDVLDKQCTYVMMMINPFTTTNDYIEIFNSLIMEYECKNVVFFGLVNEPSGNERLPDKDRALANEKFLLYHMNRMGEKTPQFLVAVDQTRTIKDPENMLGRYLNFSPKVYQRRSIPQPMPQLYVVNKKAELAWTGNIKDLHYYLDDIILEKYRWRDYQNAYNLRNMFYDYLHKSSFLKSCSKAKKLGEMIVEQENKNPDLLVDFSRLIVKKSIFEFKDVRLALSSCKKARRIFLKNNEGKEDSQICAALSEIYYENGFLFEAIRMAKLALKLGFKEVKTFEEGRTPYYRLEKWLTSWEALVKQQGKSEFKKRKEAEIRFATEFWPLISNQNSKVAAKHALKISNDVFKGLCGDVGKISEIHNEICLGFDVRKTNLAAKHFCQNVVKQFNAALPKKWLAVHQDLVASLAFYELKFGDVKKADKLLKKAINLNPNSAKARGRYSLIRDKKIAMLLK